MEGLAYDAHEPVNATQKVSGRPGQVEHETDRLGVEIAELYSLIDRLYDRLQPITLTRPSEPSSEARPEVVKAPLAQQLADRADALVAANGRLSYLLESLEL